MQKTHLNLSNLNRSVNTFSLVPASVVESLRSAVLQYNESGNRIPGAVKDSRDNRCKRVI